MLKNFDQLLDGARNVPAKRLVIAAAEEEEVLKAVQLATGEGFVKSLLVGDSSQFRVSVARLVFPGGGLR